MPKAGLCYFSGNGNIDVTRYGKHVRSISIHEITKVSAKYEGGPGFRSQNEIGSALQLTNLVLFSKATDNYPLAVADRAGFVAALRLKYPTINIDENL